MALNRCRIEENEDREDLHGICNIAIMASRVASARGPLIIRCAPFLSREEKISGGAGKEREREKKERKGKKKKPDNLRTLDVRVII
jgi:hypothetical protein